MASLKLLQQPRRGWSAEKRNPPARRTSIAAPSLALRHPCCPIYPRHPYLPKGAKGPENDGQPMCRSTDDPTAQLERVRHRVHRAPHASPQSSIAASRWPFATLLPDLPSPSLPAQGGEGGQGTMLNHRVGQLATQTPSRSGVRHRVHWAKRLATILRTAGGQGQLEVAPEALTRVAESGLERSLMRPDFSERRVFADQFQPNGVIRGQRFCCSNFCDTSAVSRGGGQRLYWHL